MKGEASNAGSTPDDTSRKLDFTDAQSLKSALRKARNASTSSANQAKTGRASSAGSIQTSAIEPAIGNERRLQNTTIQEQESIQSSPAKQHSPQHFALPGNWRQPTNTALPTNTASTSNAVLTSNIMFHGDVERSVDPRGIFFDQNTGPAIFKATRAVFENPHDPNRSTTPVPPASQLSRTPDRSQFGHGSV